MVHFDFREMKNPSIAHLSPYRLIKILTLEMKLPEKYCLDLSLISDSQYRQTNLQEKSAVRHERLHICERPAYSFWTK